MTTANVGPCIDLEPHVWVPKSPPPGESTSWVKVRENVWEADCICERCKGSFRVTLDCSGPLCKCGHLTSVHGDEGCPGCGCTTPIPKSSNDPGARPGGVDGQKTGN